jgi:hypothetical protein
VQAQLRCKHTISHSHSLDLSWIYALKPPPRLNNFLNKPACIPVAPVLEHSLYATDKGLIEIGGSPYLKYDSISENS